MTNHLAGVRMVRVPRGSELRCADRQSGIISQPSTTPEASMREP